MRQEQVRPRLLIVDDDPILLDWVCRVLNPIADLFTAADGREGLALLERERPDLVVLDCGLEGESELKLMDRIRRPGDMKGMPIVILSARSSAWHRRVMQLYGADAVLQKPVTAEQLRERILSLLNRNESD